MMMIITVVEGYPINKRKKKVPRENPRFWFCLTISAGDETICVAGESTTEVVCINESSGRSCGTLVSAVSEEYISFT